MTALLAQGPVDGNTNDDKERSKIMLLIELERMRAVRPLLKLSCKKWPRASSSALKVTKGRNQV